MRPTARRTLQFESLEGKALMAPLSAPYPLAATAIVTQQDDGEIIEPNRTDTDRFEANNKEVEYRLKYLSGRYRFDHKYDMDYKRVSGHNGQTGNPGVGAVEAVFVFQERLQSWLSGQPIDPADYPGIQIEKENFRIRNGKVTYDLRFRSGDFRFDHSYKMTFRRANWGPDDGQTAIQAIDYFQGRLSENILFHSPVAMGNGAGTNVLAVRRARA